MSNSGIVLSGWAKADRLPKNSSSSLAKQQSKFEYNANNDLVKTTDPKGNQFKYEYDAKRNISKATSAMNVVYSFQYDSNGNPTKTTIGGATYISSSATYTSYGNYISSLTDSLGNTVGYNFDSKTGNLLTSTDAKGNVITNDYDSNDRLTSVTKKADGANITNTYAYKNDKIDTIGHNGFSYNFIYDSIGRTTGVNVGSQRLITNTYEANGGNLTESTYGNGAKVQTDYDNIDTVVAKKVNGTEISHYSYDSSGNLGLLEDKVNNVSYKYTYDLADRLVKVTDSKGNIYKNGYDSNNNVSKQTSIINGNVFDTGYEFDKDNKVTKITLDDPNKFVAYTYDELARATDKTINFGNTKTYKTTFGYLPGVNGSSSTKVGSINNNGSVLNYTYDKNGNIETVKQGDNLVQKYYYNELSELIREDNKELNKTIKYTYDAGGNIVSKSEYAYTNAVDPGTATGTIGYQYGDANWKDKLTSYNGKAITYDAIGNPLTYDGYTYKWERGRTLTGITGNNKTIAYKYNDSGIRTEKNVNGVISKYTLQGDKVAYEEVTNGSNVDRIYYSYDAQSNLVSINLNNIEYYYVRNIQGDIIGLIDTNGTQVVSYTYDSWGKLISIDGSLKDSVGTKNPYRYRGYRYDTEIGLYYLQSRYYNPEWGRFINADGLVGTPGELLSHNMFAYCNNNPINCIDPDGEFFWFIPAIIAAAEIIVAAVEAVIVTVGICVMVSDVYRDLSSRIKEADNTEKNKPTEKNPKERHLIGEIDKLYKIILIVMGKILSQKRQRNMQQRRMNFTKIGTNSR